MGEYERIFPVPEDPKLTEEYQNCLQESTTLFNERTRGGRPAAKPTAAPGFGSTAPRGGEKKEKDSAREPSGVGRESGGSGGTGAAPTRSRSSTGGESNEPKPRRPSGKANSSRNLEQAAAPPQQGSERAVGAGGAPSARLLSHTASIAAKKTEKTGRSLSRLHQQHDPLYGSEQSLAHGGDWSAQGEPETSHPSGVSGAGGKISVQQELGSQA